MRSCVYFKIILSMCVLQIRLICVPHPNCTGGIGGKMHSYIGYSYKGPLYLVGYWLCWLLFMVQHYFVLALFVVCVRWWIVLITRWITRWITRSSWSPQMFIGICGNTNSMHPRHQLWGTKSEIHGFKPDFRDVNIKHGWQSERGAERMLQCLLCEVSPTLPVNLPAR